MKVCHLTSAHDSDDGRIFRMECVSIATYDDFDVYLIAPGESRVEDGVTVIGIGEKPSSRYKRIFQFTRKLFKEAVKLDADIYHFHDPELLNIGYKLKKMGKAVVFDSHENTYEQIKIKKYIPKFLRNKVANIYLKKETKICKYIDAVILPCLFDGKNPFENRCKQTVFVNNYPNLREFENIKQDDIKYDLCHIGTLNYDRGITFLLKAVKEAKASLLLGGVFETKEYEDELRQQGLLDNVDYVGYCTKDDVLKYYSESLIGISSILPVGQYSAAENLPTKIYEFMAMGKAVIISDLPYSYEVMKEYEFALITDPTNIQQTAEAINQLKDDRELRERLGKNGHRAIQEKMCWEVEHKKIIDLYRRIYK